MDISNKAIRDINVTRLITNADWLKIKDVCSSIYGKAELIIDGFEVTIHRRLQRVKNGSQIKVINAIFVNGVMEGKWFNGFDCKTGRCDSEEVTRFFPLQTKMRHSDAKKELSKLKSKKKIKFIKDFYEELYGKDFLEQKLYFQCSNPSFQALKKHWIANNKSIEVFSIDGELA